LQNIGERSTKKTECDNSQHHEQNTKNFLEIGASTDISVPHSSDCCNCEVERYQVLLSRGHLDELSWLHPSSFVIGEWRKEYPQARDDMSDQQKDYSHEDKSLESEPKFDNFSYVFEELAPLFHNFKNS